QIPVPVPKDLQIIYSDPRSPAAITTEVPHQFENCLLTDKIGGLELSYGLSSFFQVNLPVFETALGDMKAYAKPGSMILDLYCGVGTIGLALAKNAERVELVDSVPECIEFAGKNIESNGIKNAKAVLSPAEKAVNLITADKLLILDPPRSGLHPKLIKKILEVKPKRIIYLSCNAASQARDIALIKEHYKIGFLKFYNFFPRTPHIEGLCVCDII
ncbi:MAG: methyltransferase, partial [Candidatus Margulisiibacteriota bacterium]